MAKTLPQLKAEIARLQAEAEAKQREARSVIARIKEAIEHYGLTAEDLGFSGGSGRRVGKASSAGKVREPANVRGTTTKSTKASKPRKTRASYSDGVNTWSGMGPKPKWFKEALASGKPLESLIVNP